MKTILVIAYHYPPENSSCSEKNVRIVKRLLYEGYKVRVLTCNYTDEVFTEGNLAVYHTKSGLFHKDIVSCSNASVPCIDISNNKRLKDRIKSFLSGIAIPDATFDWNYEAIKFIKHNKSILSNVDLIYSISSPYSAHLLSYRISKMIKVPFIMCYGDPWIYEPKRKRGPLRYSIEKRMEGRLIDSAAGVSLITEWNRKEYIKLYGIPNDKINTYLIGFDRKNECKPLLDNKK